MDTKQLDTLRLVSIMELSGALPGSVTLQAASELRRQHAEIETLRAGYDAARLEIASLHTQMEAVGAGGMEPLRKRECLHQISEPARCLCPYCGNKRCPKANDHRHDCTGSNEPGQQGSAYPSQGITAAQKGGQHGTD